jgi:DNA-binding GntR family transcriptional regulator
VREAFRRLAAEGLIELVPNRGALVRRLSLRDALELFEIRTELEALAARRAAARAAEPEVRRGLEAAAAAVAAEHPAPGADYIAENRAFHAAILTAAGNLRLAEMHERLQLSLILAQIRHSLAADVLAASLAEHRRIAAAILEGDAAGAERELRAHLARARDIVRGMPADAFAP